MNGIRTVEHALKLGLLRGAELLRLRSVKRINLLSLRLYLSLSLCLGMGLSSA